jgi:hypothetical protein
MPTFVSLESTYPAASVPSRVDNRHGHNALLTPPPPVKKENGVWTGTNTHWAMNVGFGLYTATTLLKRFSNFGRSFNHNNPTGLLGSVGGTVSNVFLNIHRDLFSKYLLQITNSMTGLATRTKDLNSHLSMIQQEHAGISLSDATGLHNMRHWLNRSFIRRMLTAQLTQADHYNLDTFFRYTWKTDFIQGAQNFKESLVALKDLGKEGFKKLQNPQYIMRKPELLYMIKHKSDTKALQTVSNLNGYKYGHGLVAGSTLAITADFASQLLGIHHIAKFVTVPALVAGEVALTWGKITDTSNIWNGVNTLKKRPWYYRPMAVGRIGAAVLAGVANTFWAQDSMLGWLRIAAGFRAPYEIFHDLFEVLPHNNKTYRPKPDEKANLISVLSRGNRGIMMFADILAGVVILGAPQIQRWEGQHHVSANPFDPKSVWYHVDPKKSPEEQAYI